MDVASALASVASRKQLRRLGGALEVSVDEGGSLDELLSLNATTVAAATAKQWRAETFKKVGGNTVRWKELNTATFQKRCANGKNLGLCDAPDVAADCMDLSALVRCDVAAL